MLILILFSAFFSGMESAIFSISKFRIKTLVFDNAKGARCLARLKEKSGETLSTLLLLNNIVNIGASSLATVMISEILLNHRLHPIFFYIIEVFLMAFILLVFGEITPKTIALNNAEFFSLNFGIVIEILNKITLPFTRATNVLVHLILPRRRVVHISEEDITQMLFEAKKLKIIDDVEVELGYRILRFGRTLVEEIMVPAQKVVGIDQGMKVGEAMQIIKKTGHSRICVFDNNKVVGVLYAKDLLLKKLPPDTPITEIMRTPFYIFKNKPIDELLGEFRKKGVHFAVVTDQNNTFIGILTLADVFKYLFGEIPEP